MLIILGVEYLLWLGSNGRLMLLVLFIAIESFLLYKYILTPLFYLFRLKKGLSNKKASVLIGKHFPEVGDKLYNLLELADDPAQSELLLASIEQRSENLKSIPFTKAINYKDGLVYGKYLLIPLILLGALWLTGNLNSFFGSYDRVVNYKMAYEPPAPFTFKLLNNSLTVLESEPLNIQVITEGKIKPLEVYMVMDGKEILLKTQNGVHSYNLSAPLNSSNLYFISNGIKSHVYSLKALKTPVIQSFNMLLEYPQYLNKPNELVRSGGNATIPEGTKINWRIVGEDINTILMKTKDTSFQFENKGNDHALSKRIYQDFAYTLSTSNSHVSNYEALDYNLTVIRDAYPSIAVEEVKDSLNPNISYYIGEASDDYSISQITLVCYPQNNGDKKQVLKLPTSKSNFDQFYYTFPSGLNLEPGQNYDFYFEVTDNDGIHKGKSTKSKVFSTTVLNAVQLNKKELENQQDIIKNMDKSLTKFKSQREKLEEINKEQKEKSNLNFNDKNQISDFLQKQQQQEKLMQKFSKQLNDNLEKTGQDKEMNKLLQERLERQEIEAKKNEKLLEELNKIADKIDKEELAERLEQIAKKQQNSERNLEQLLELTKRYYVQEKASQLAKDLENLAKRQEALSKEPKEDLSPEPQDFLNKEFKELAKELEELQKDNKGLKKPMSLDIDSNKKEQIKKDQNEALEELKKETGDSQSSEEEQKENSANKAAKKQKSASDKIQQMSEALQQSASSSDGGSTITEDAEMLRQILDNLLVFSFKQEKLYDKLAKVDEDVSQNSQIIRDQQELKNLFEHVDDSLFALSLRLVDLTEIVNEQITEVYYNVDKALDNLAESRTYQSLSSQQYVLTASNTLADLLANILNNMQQSMQSGKGSSSGDGEQGFQLPDIIKGQGELKDKMGQMGKGGKSPSDKGEAEAEGKGTEKGEGQKGGEGGQGKDGQQGEGKDGKGGRNGSSGGQNGEGNEKELQEIYQIYKEQQLLREQLAQQLLDMINREDRDLTKKLLQQMEDFENDLLENGITKRGIEKINNIQHELMKLENAVLKQGQKSERESNTSNRNFSTPITTKPSGLENYRNDIEILNRQALPLRQIYKEKVKTYFKKND
ncbi:hypothetical protein [Sediminicola sp. YIK13]|uniref:hypothetical protein n=1 Tax=Sediminicola sp. YIK13 TaxID=1453352 RepID=UPI001F245955|nr:hypothetical protein [Sediminicola sp. YIK13]